MCVVSFIGDHFNEKWDPYKQSWQKPHFPDIVPQPSTGTNPSAIFYPPLISREEFDKLKKEVEEMKKLLIKAKIYDEKNNEPNCEMEAKMKFLRQVAEFVGINLDDVIGKAKENEVP